jgi:hypothetical protein
VEEAEVSEVDKAREAMGRLLNLEADYEEQHPTINEVYDDALFLAKLMRDGKLAFYEEEGTK